MNQLVKTSTQYTPEQVALIKSQIAPKASADELKYFLQQCYRTQLDPFSRQIYAIHRWNGMQKKEVMTIQVSIDGFRVIAERSGNYAGQGEPEFTEVDGKLTCCKVRVYKFGPNGQRYEAAVGVAYWDEYKQTDKEGRVSGLWAKMPHVMLSKVAEAVALRKAFPQDLSGLYTSEEMQQADKPEPGPDRAEKELLNQLVNTSDLNDDERVDAYEAIENCVDYKMYERIQHRLEARQQPIDTIVNPSQADINNHLRKVTAG